MYMFWKTFRVSVSKYHLFAETSAWEKLVHNSGPQNIQKRSTCVRLEKLLARL